MRAVIYENYGQPEVLQIKEVEKPKPTDNELLIKVKATSVNRTDCANLTAKPFIMRFSFGLFKPRIQIGGTEFAGEVVEKGKNVTQFDIGDKIFGFDDSILSSYAEYLTIGEDKGMALMPDNISFEQAAVSSEGVHYGFNFINKVDLKPGDKVLVNGASGGIGSATVQMLHYHGAVVTAVCNTKNVELVRSLGASKVIDYLKEDFTQLDDQFDYVFDSVGKSSYGKCKRIMKPGAVYISSELGKGSQNIFLALLSAIFGSLPGQAGRKVGFPYPPNIRRSVLFIKKLIEEGKFKPVIDRTYLLEEIADAFSFVLTGQKTGNVVVKVDEG